MSEGSNKKFKFVSEPDTPLEAVEQLQEFFEEDMWYAVNNEWDTEEDMLEYLRGHFSICKKGIKKLEQCDND